MTNYDDIYNRAKQKAEQQQSDYSAQRQQQNQTYTNNINSIYDNQQKYKEDDAQRQINNVPQQYRPQYDHNAVQQLVSQRLAKERAANMGLANSGWQRSMETGAAVQKQNADTATSQAIQAAIDKIQQAKSASINDLNLQRQQKIADAAQQSGNDVLNNYTALMNAAGQNASSIYNTDVSAEQAALDRAIQQRIANTQIGEQQRQTEAQRQFNIDQLKAQTKSANKQMALQLIQALENQGVPAETAVAQILGNGVNFQQWLNS